MIHATLREGLHLDDWSATRIPDRAMVTKRIRDDVRIPNPEFYMAEKIGRSTWNINRHIRCYTWDKSTDRLTLPLAYLPRLVTHLQGDIYIDDQRTLSLAPPVHSKIQLREYQVPAVEAMLDALKVTGWALLKAPPGSGKTEMALEIAARIGQKTLWITHTKELAEQARQRATQRLGLEPTAIGMIGAGEKTVGRLLTIGLVQTLSNMDLKSLTTTFGCVILDECHHSPATTWSQVLGSFAARYRFGVTGSLERQDGLQTITHLYLGPVTHKIERGPQSLGAGGVKTHLRTIKTRTEPDSWKRYLKREEKYKEARAEYKSGRLAKAPRKPRMPYSRILSELLDDDARNRLIVKLLLDIYAGHHTLVLSQRVGHCRELANRMKAIIPDIAVEVIHGEQAMGTRQDILDRARAGKIDILFSVNIAKEGLDVPILDQLVLAAPGKDPIYLTQAIGRIQRTIDGKRHCTVFDVVDEAVGVFKAQCWKRMQVYRQLGMATNRKKQTA